MEIAHANGSDNRNRVGIEGPYSYPAKGRSHSLPICVQGGNSAADSDFCTSEYINIGASEAKSRNRSLGGGVRWRALRTKDEGRAVIY